MLIPFSRLGEIDVYFSESPEELAQLLEDANTFGDVRAQKVLSSNSAHFYLNEGSEVNFYQREDALGTVFQTYRNSHIVQVLKEYVRAKLKDYDGHALSA